MNLMDPASSVVVDADGGLEQAVVDVDAFVVVLAVATGRVSEVQRVEGFGAEAPEARGEGVGNSGALKEWGHVIDGTGGRGATFEHG